MADAYSPRALAILILSRVERSEAFLNVVLDGFLDTYPLRDPRDSAFVTELCYGTMRRLITLDHALIPYSLARPYHLLRPELRAALRIGAYQIFYLRVPGHAAVAETVEAFKEVSRVKDPHLIKSGGAAGVINAMLRRMTELEDLPLPLPQDLVDHLSVRESHPKWLAESWIARFGPRRAEAMMIADNGPAPLTLRTNSSKISRDDLGARLIDAGVTVRQTVYARNGLILDRAGKVEGILGYSEGLWQVQDEAAQLVVEYGEGREGARVLDACAAPGGKTCQLAERSDQVVAVDIHQNKLPRLMAEAERLGLASKVQALAHDSRRPFPAELGSFDFVLVDAPCSGLGTLRRHPEIRYRRDVATFEGRLHLARAILRNCLSVVRPGGLLVFSVCSTEPTEGEDQVKAALADHPQFFVEAPLDWKGPPLDQGFLRTLPGPEGMDGFFAARLRRHS